MITITLNQIKSANPCIDGWRKVLKANGGNQADMDSPFPLASILDSNDLEDTLWVISNVPEMKEHDEIWRKFSTWCALQNAEKIAKYCSKKDYELIIEWLETGNLEIRESAESAAWSAAESAAWSAAESAAESAAWSAAESARSAAESARSAAESAAESAARSAAWSAAESAAWSARSAAWSAQSEKLRQLINQ